MKKRHRWIAGIFFALAAATGVRGGQPAVLMLVPVGNANESDLFSSAQKAPIAENIPFVDGFGASDKQVVLFTSSAQGRELWTFDRQTLKPGPRRVLSAARPEDYQEGALESAHIVGNAVYYLGLTSKIDVGFVVGRYDLETSAEAVFEAPEKIWNPFIFRAGDRLLIESGKTLYCFLPVTGKFGPAITLKEAQVDLVYLKGKGTFACAGSGRIQRVADSDGKPADEPAWDTGMPLAQSFAVQVGGEERILALSAPLAESGFPTTETCSAVLLDPAAKKKFYQQPLEIRGDAKAIVSANGQALRIWDKTKGVLLAVDVASGKPGGEMLPLPNLSDLQRKDVKLVAEAGS